MVIDIVPPVDEKLLHDIVLFSAAHLDSGDIDPVYPVLRSIIQGRGLSEEEALWTVLCYVAFYNLPSALICLEAYPDGPPSGMDDMIAGLPCGVERRGFRGGTNLKVHMEALAATRARAGSLSDWMAPAVSGNPGDNWTLVNTLVGTVWGNGRWAAYKTAELVEKVLGYPLAPTDCGHQFSSGPRKGIELLYGPVEGNGADAIAVLDARSLDLYELVAGSGLELDLAQLETILCDFHTMWDGRYYVGHDIDQMQEQLHTLDYIPESVEVEIWQAREAGLSLAYLGERNGWRGVDKARKAEYKRTGQILVREDPTNRRTG